MQAVAAFARANKLDRIMLDSPAARLGIVATGKAYLDLRQALADLGITDQAGQELGFRIYKVALTWPLEEAGARRFAEGLQDVLVIEEKRGFIEDQLVRLLYNMDAPKRPTVVGKRDERGAVLLPSEGELTPTMVASAVMSRLRRLGYQAPASEQRLARLELHEKPAVASSIKLHRTPYFCSGCPHNSSTKIPDGEPRHGGNRAVTGWRFTFRTAAPPRSHIWAARAPSGLRSFPTNRKNIRGGVISRMARQFTTGASLIAYNANCGRSMV